MRAAGAAGERARRSAGAAAGGGAAGARRGAGAAGAAAMAEPAEKLYRAEYAKSGRASCKKCGESIAKDSLRLALMVQVPRGGRGWGGRAEPAAPLGTAQPIFNGGAFGRCRVRSGPRAAGAAGARAGQSPAFGAVAGPGGAHRGALLPSGAEAAPPPGFPVPRGACGARRCRCRGRGIPARFAYETEELRPERCERAGAAPAAAGGAGSRSWLAHGTAEPQSASGLPRLGLLPAALTLFFAFWGRDFSASLWKEGKSPVPSCARTRPPCPAAGRMRRESRGRGCPVPPRLQQERAPAACWGRAGLGALV